MATGVCDRKRYLYCKQCNRRQQLCKCRWRRTLHRKPRLFCDLQRRQFKNFDCKFLCCKSCSFCVRVATKERHNSQLLSPLSRNKACERCFLHRSVQFCTKCHKYPSCCTKSTCRGQITPVLGKMGTLRCQSQSTSSPQRRLHPPLPVPAKFDQGTHSNQLLCKSPQDKLPVGGIASAVRQKCSRVSPKSTVPGVLQPVIFSSQTQQPVETYLGSEQTQHILENTIFQNGDTRDYKNLPPDGGVGYFHRFQGRLLPHTNQQPVQEVHTFSHPGQILQIQSTILWSVHSPHGVHSSGQRNQIHSNEKGYKDPPVPRQLVGQSQIPPNLSPAYADPSSSLSRIGLASEQRKIRAGTQTSFQFRRLPVRLEGGQGQTHTRALADPTDKNKGTHIQSSMPGPKFNVPHQVIDSHRKTSTFRPFTLEAHQWHLKNKWRVPETLEKVIPIPKSLHPHLKWWLEESNVLTGQPLHPLKHALQIFTDASKEGWGTHLNELTARGTWSLPESKLHINHLELKVVFLALKEFQDLCSNNIVLVATDNTTVVAYINKERGMKLGSPCALLWRILSWCTRKQVTLKARHIPGRLNVIADKLSRPGQTIQTEWSLHPEVFKAICNWWHQPEVDLFATRFNNKLPQFVSPVPDPQAWAVDALSLSWEDLDPYAFPPAAILGKVVEKLQDYSCNRVILIAPGRPNMPWFWDLVAMSSQIPLCLPNLHNLVSQPFNQTLRRSLSNLNLYDWLLEPQQSRSRASLRQWQHELRLLKEDQPDPSMRQSGPFLQSGASVIRWTSGHHL